MGIVKFWDPDDSERPNFPAASGDWLIDPVAEGLTQAAYTDGTGPPLGTLSDPDTVDDYTYAERAATVDIIADAGAEGGRLIRFIYPAGGATEGTEPGVLFFSWPSDADTIYIRFRWRMSDPWDAHSSGVNKILFSSTGGDNNFVLTARGSGPYTLQPIVDAGDDASAYLEHNLGTVQYSAGDWVRVEIFASASGDALGMAFDAVQVLDRIGNDGYVGAGDQTFDFNSAATPHWGEFQVAPTWGGSNPGEEKAQEDYYYFDLVDCWYGTAGNELAAWLQGDS